MIEYVEDWDDHIRVRLVDSDNDDFLMCLDVEDAKELGKKLLDVVNARNTEV